MNGFALRMCLVAGLVVAATFASTASASVSARAGICPTFKLGGLKIRWEAIGGLSCGAAKPWLLKLQKDHVGTGFGNVKLHNGPPGYHCMATGAHAGHPTGGACYTGTLAYPGKGFTWNGT